MGTNVVIRLLPDGSGRVCIHWLMADAEGPIETVNRIVVTGMGPQIMKGKRWRMACNPTLSNLGELSQAGRLVPYPHSDDIRAVTCPKCLATERAKEILARLNTTVPGV